MPDAASPGLPHVAVRSWCARVALLVLACSLGLALWLRFGYEQAPGPQRISIVARQPPVAFVLERTPGDRVPISEFSGAGFELRDDGVLEATRAGARVTYSGSVGSRVIVTFERGPAGGRAAVLVDGKVARRVDLHDDVTGTVFVPLAFELRLPPASAFLLALLGVASLPVAWCVVWGWAWLATRARWLPVVAAVAALLVSAGVVLLLVDPSPVQRYEVAVEHLGVADTRAGDRAMRARILPTGVDGLPQRVHALDAQGWSGMASPAGRLELRNVPRTGVVRVRVNGRVRVLEPRTATAEPVVIRLGDVAGIQGGLDRWVLRVSRAGDILLLSVVLWVLVVGTAGTVAWARSRDGPSHRKVRAVISAATWRQTFGFALVPLVGWLLLLVVFWPGPMNPDALSQWFQVEDGILADWHPYLLAVLFAGLRALVDSPWLPILLVATGASVIVGRFGAWSVARARSPRAVVASSFLLFLVPATALHTVTLWKDSFYGVGLLALVLCLWRIEDTRGYWLTRRSNLAFFALVGAGTWLVRHNGWPVVLGSMLVVALCHRRWWRQFLAAAAGIVLVVGIVRVPLARALDVGPNPVDEIVYVQHISLHLQRGTELRRSEKRFLEAIRPLDEVWPYQCSSIQPTWSGADAIPIDDYQSLGDELRSLALRLAWRNPGAELDHLACASKIVWQPWSSGSFTYFMEWYESGGRVHYIPVWLDKSPMEDPASPRLALAVFRAVDRIPDWLVRPAVYLYALVIAVVVAIRRTRSWAPLRIVSPALLQSVLLAVVSLTQDVRFQYGVVLVAVVLVPMLLTARQPEQPDGPVFMWGRSGHRSRAATGEKVDQGSEALEANLLADA